MSLAANQQSMRQEKEHARAEALAKKTTEDTFKTEFLVYLEDVLEQPRFDNSMKNISKVDCNHLYNNRWRINFWCDDGCGNAVVEHSFYVAWDEEEHAPTYSNPNPVSVFFAT